ncbi:glycosyltransferase family 2 protein [Paenibacillus pinistramenti]|uniref:glycosyltransferase family 2 protein n=1 Tax=Paenibacillus pinistramenti TaxID=1768003 RepID=UPI001109E105|nr:glycosyltransferase [Paenibacillus pinistramenti]
MPGKKSAALWLEKARTAGREAGAAWREGSGAGAESGAESGAGAVPGPAAGLKHFREALFGWFAGFHQAKRPSFAEALSQGLVFRDGYAGSSGLQPEQLGAPVPLAGTASVVISVSDEEETIGRLLDELQRLPLQEIIVVLNGCTDHSFAEVRKRSGILMVNDPQRLGHDVGRSIGAALAGGDAVLFLDGDMAVPAEELAAFLYEQESGADVVLNNITGFLPVYGRQDEVSRCKLFLNQALGRPDLHSNSLTAVPHVLSRRTLSHIGTSVLAVPPKAQAAAVLAGLHVTAPCTVDVIRRNRLRQSNSGSHNKVAQLIIGDHAEALGEAIRRRGPRLHWTSLPRAELAKVRNGR